MSNCLVVVDVQEGFISEQTSEVPKKVVGLMESDVFDHVVATRYENIEDSPFVRFLGWKDFFDEASRKVYSGVLERAEQVFPKTTYTCFTSQFIRYIERNSIDELYIAGIDTDCCVLASATDAFERGIRPVVMANYCASNGGAQSHDAALRVMERTIGPAQINYSTVV